MAVVAFLNGGNISTANNANKVIASNLGTWGTAVQLANTRVIPFTPSVAETAIGVIVGIWWGGQPTGTLITAKLQFFNGVSWVDVAGTTKTLNSTEVSKGFINTLPINNLQGQFSAFFQFPTPALLTAVAGVWRIDITVSGGGNPFLLTCDGTANNIAFAIISQTTTTYVDNTDQIIVYNNPITLDANTTLLGALQTGDATRATCGWVGSSNLGTYVTTDTTMLKILSNNINFTIKGFLQFFSLSAFQAGTEASRVSGVELNFNSASVGTAVLTGFSTTGANLDNGSLRSKFNLFLYGSVPAVEDTYLTANSNIGAGSITVEHDTAWANGDKIAIGGMQTQGFADLTKYTVSSVSGKTINFTPNIAGSNRVAGTTCTITIATPAVISLTNHGLWKNDEVLFRTTGAFPTGITAGTKYFVKTATVSTFTISATVGGAEIATTGTQSGVHTLIIPKVAGRVFRLNGYGITAKTNVSGGVFVRLGQPSNIICKGVRWQDTAILTSNGTEVDNAGNQVFLEFSNSSTENTTSPVQTQGSFLTFVGLNKIGLKVDNVNAFRQALLGAISTTAGQSVKFQFYNSINILFGFVSNQGYSGNSGTIQHDYQDNHFENTNVQMTMSASASQFLRNKFWGNNSGLAHFRMNSMINSYFEKNIFDNNARALQFVSTVVNTIWKRESFQCLFGQTHDITFGAGFASVELNTPSKSIIFDPSISNNYLSNVAGSVIRVSNNARDTKDHYTLTIGGKTQSTTAGLPDTTTRLGSGSALRITSESSINQMQYPTDISDRAIPTGNIKNKIITVGGWVKINSASFWAGVHTMPRLYIKFDDETIQYKEAIQTTEWQYLYISVSPLTEFGQVESWYQMLTSATGTNAHVYLDDRVTQLPPDSYLNLGNLDLFAKGVPVLPPISSISNATDFWQADLSGFGNGTAGHFLFKKLTARFLAFLRGGI